MDAGEAIVKFPALFLDRDGTINFDRVYINDARLVELIPQAGEAIAKAQKNGFKIVVVTNQSGVGRGIIEKGALDKIHARLDELLAQKGATIDSYKMCIHHPSDNCECRKPKPFLVHEAAKELEIDVARSYFIGDKMSDVQAGKNAGCRASILLLTGKGEKENTLLQLKANGDTLPDRIEENLFSAVNWILSDSKS